MRRNHDIFDCEFQPYEGKLVLMDDYREHLRIGREVLTLLGIATILAIALSVFYVGI